RASSCVPSEILYKRGFCHIFHTSLFLCSGHQMLNEFFDENQDELCEQISCCRFRIQTDVSVLLFRCAFSCEFLEFA
ncbi:hypothetical protein PMAYCL1PPCAC_08874, partial [Pristionchus mayeri]